MGVLFFYDKFIEPMDDRHKGYQVEVADNHGTPEIRVGPKDAAYSGNIVSFNKFEEFEEFVEAINDLHRRLSPIE